MKPEDAMGGAIVRGDIATIRSLLATHPQLLHVYEMRKNWLHLAAQKGNVDIMALMLDAGLPIDQPTTDGGDTALSIAATQRRYQACIWLLDHGADINYGLKKKATPVFSAIYGNSLEIVDLFVKRGADLTATFGHPPRDVIGFSKVYGTPQITALLRENLH